MSNLLESINCVKSEISEAIKKRNKTVVIGKESRNSLIEDITRTTDDIDELLNKAVSHYVKFHTEKDHPIVKKVEEMIKVVHTARNSLNSTYSSVSKLSKELEKLAKTNGTLK